MDYSSLFYRLTAGKQFVEYFTFLGTDIATRSSRRHTSISMGRNIEG
jgi:hypothetical protein